MAKSSKGSKFERSICTELSLWWTGGERDDIFWRTAGSGARAKVRGRKGKNTKGQSGDICAIDPIGEPLISLITIEMKRGYSKNTIADLLDAPSYSAMQVFEMWIGQAQESSNNSKTPFWMIMHQRDRRQTVVYYPTILYGCLRDFGSFKNYPDPYMNFKFDGVWVSAMTLHSFISEIDPHDIKLALKHQ